MAAGLHLLVLTPERRVWDAPIRSLVFPGADGFFGVLPGHAALLSIVAAEKVRFVDGEGKERLLAVSQGFVEVLGGVVKMVVGAAELAEEIDVERALKALARAKEQLAQRREEGVDPVRAELALKRAIARLHAARPGLGVQKLERPRG